MKKNITLLVWLACSVLASAQTPLSIKLDEKSTLQINFGMDAYYSYDARSAQDDDIVLRDMAGTCTYNDEMRLNLVYLNFLYNSENIHSKIAFQHGDAPLIMAPDEKKFIKFLRNAYFGVKICERTWLDFGYMNNPIGIESSELRKNYLSTVSGPGFIDPGNMLGVALNYQLSDQIATQLSYFNSFSIVDKNTKNKSVGWMASYSPSQDFVLMYAGQTGDESLKGAPRQLQIFNSLMLMANVTNKLSVSAQFDFVSQTNSSLADTTKPGYYFAGLLQFRYKLSPEFGIAARGDFFNDPDGFMTGGVSGSKPPFSWAGASFGAEYKPTPNTFFRAEYQWLQANQGIFQEWDRTRRSIILSSGFWL